MLTPSQTDALNFMLNYANQRKVAANITIDHILRMSDIPRILFDEVFSKTKSSMRVALHFHPDRLDQNRNTVAQALLDCGIYKNQFETKLSSGSISAHVGGQRDLWEEQLFGGAYRRHGVDGSQRPKYGAIDFFSYSDGPSPRFGSCYFLLKAEVSRRCTFTFRDSYLTQKQRGTFDEFDDIVAALLSCSFADEIVLGEPLRPPQLVEKLSDSYNEPFAARFLKSPKRILDHYIEAQVHGNISLERDIEFLIADPSFEESVVGDMLKTLSRKFGITLYWHSGSYLSTSDVPSNFRGSTMPSLARLIAPDGILDAKKIGDAATSLRFNPKFWLNRGQEEDVLQELKHLWHVLLKYGKQAN